MPSSLSHTPRHTSLSHQLLLVFLGGGTGTAVRLAIDLLMPRPGGVPVAIVLINLSGAFALGWLTAVLAAPGCDAKRAADRRLFLGTGVLGGFTTYSALALATTEFLIADDVMMAVLYLVGTVALGVLAAAAGLIAGRRSPDLGSMSPSLTRHSPEDIPR